MNMIQKVTFNDFRMFSGLHSIHFSPITIFTGPNNSGKSTLIRLIKKLVDHSNGLWVNEPDFKDYIIDHDLSYSKSYDLNDPYLTHYQKEMALSPDISNLAVREITINNISFKYDQYIKNPTSVHFSENGILLATIDPIADSHKEEMFSSLCIHLDNISRLKSNWYSGPFKNEAEAFKRNLEIIIKNEWPENLFKIMLNPGKSKEPLFSLGEDNKNNLKVILHEHTYPYRGILNDSYLSFLSCYSRDIYDAIRKNPLLPQNYKAPFINVLEFIFRFFILSELDTLT